MRAPTWVIAKRGKEGEKQMPKADFLKILIINDLFTRTKRLVSNFK